MSTAERQYRIGWIVDSAPSRAYSLPWQALGPVSSIRYGGIARYLHDNDPSLLMERALPWRRYDAIVFLKKLNPAVLKLAAKVKGQGIPIIFDSNVNYYEEWGEFQIPGTRPTAEQKQMALEMTRLADQVIADSSYLAGLCRAVNPSTVMIPDAVDTDLYAPGPQRPADPRLLKLIWSGISKKAHHLQFIEPLLIAQRQKIDLTLVINRPHPQDPPSPVIERLRQAAGARVAYYDYRGYVAELQQADVIISPKILSSSYEMAHTEYKITTGMAVGLPAVASAQPSYEEAIGDGVGGWICRTEKDWGDLFGRLLADRPLIRAAGVAARQRVLERYSIPVVAALYGRTLKEVMKGRA